MAANCMDGRAGVGSRPAQWPVGVGASYWSTRNRHPPLPATVPTTVLGRGAAEGSFPPGLCSPTRASAVGVLGG